MGAIQIFALCCILFYGVISNLLRNPPGRRRVSDILADGSILGQHNVGKNWNAVLGKTMP